MKRVTNNVALQTVLFAVSPLQKIRIKDRASMYDAGEVIFEGKLSDFWCGKDIVKHSQYKIERATVHGIELDGDVIVFTTEIIHEKY